MSFYAQRKRLRDMEEREAKGESFWTDQLSDDARRRCVYAIAQTFESYENPWAAMTEAVRLVGRDEGWHSQRLAMLDSNEIAVLDHDELASFLEALHVVIRDSDSWHGPARAEAYAAALNAALRRERISYELINGQIVPFESLEMHQKVVAPALTLLGNRPGFQRAETAYMAAIKELHEASGMPEDAITDCGTALQEALQVVGAEGKTLGEQRKAAITMGLFGPDDHFTGAVLRVIEGVNEVRNTEGDAHPPLGETQRENAWFMVHVVGALILRLASGHER